MPIIKLIRHSERLDRANPIYWACCIGYHWTDTPLTTNGYAMAQKAGERLAQDKSFSPTHIYSSPYTRTISTAAEIRKSYPETELVLEPLISEYQSLFSHHTAMHPRGIPTDYRGTPTGFSYPEGTDAFRRRVDFIVDKLIKKHNTDLLIVAHGAVINWLIERLVGEAPEYVHYLGTVTFQTADGEIVPGSAHYSCSPMEM